jgi:Ca2+-binding RTX toxin-like protein
MSGTLRRAAVGVGVSLTLATAPLLLGATPAHAAGGSAYVIGSTLYYVALPGQANNVTIKLGDDGRYHVVDLIAPVDPSATCSPVTSHEVSCDSDTLTAIWADSGDMADTLGVRGTLITTLQGGSGDDMLVAGDSGGTLSGGTGNDKLIGGPGADALYGGPDNDELSGNEGDDLLVGGTGADTMSGGEGTDTLSYADHSTTVTADADDALGDDGNSGERDTTISDVEQITGGPGNDTLVGGPGDDTLVGGGGSDWLAGAAGFDKLYGDELPSTRGAVGASGSGSPDQDICLLGADGGQAFNCETVR